MKELEGVCDEVFSTMTESAKASWVKRFGMDNLIELVPIFYSAYLADPIDRLGRPRSMILFINNCLTNELRYAKKTKIDFGEICK